MFEEYYRRTWEPENDISPEQTAFATSLRVPLLTTEYPRWNYITGIVVRDEQYLEVGIMPTEDEIAEVGAYLVAYRDRWLNQPFQDAMAHLAPYDIDGGANAGYYMKQPDGRWGYRKRTWRSGAHWWSHGDGSLGLCIAHNEGRAELVDDEWRITAQES